MPSAAGLASAIPCLRRSQQLSGGGVQGWRPSSGIVQEWQKQGMAQNTGGQMMGPEGPKDHQSVHRPRISQSPARFMAAEPFF
eukprot:1159073-Pelagomonas_calceolata.AAC.3